MSRISSLDKQPNLPSGVLDAGYASALVESPAEIRFLDLADPTQRAAAYQFPSGCAFGERAELRWLHRSSGWHLVSISDDDQPLSGACCAEQLTQDVDDDILLWGKKDGSEFLEGRIPGPLPYPPRAAAAVVQDKRLAVQVRYYLLPNEGVRLFRCVRLKPA
jgi:hypothetical protein